MVAGNTENMHRGNPDIWETKNFSKGDESILAGVAVATAGVLAIALILLLVFLTMKKLGFLKSRNTASRQTYEVAQEEVKIDLKGELDA